MATQPLGSPKVRYFDSNGDPLSGGLLYSYSAGTSTPLATYTTRAGDVANANPVVLDANGEANVWMTPGVLYKFELRTSGGAVQWTVDNFPSPAEEDTTGDVTTDPGGRLTLTSATPVTTSDVSGATTVYYAPYRHNKVPIYDGAAWSVESISSELSQTTTDTTKSPAAVANNSNYDLFIWSDDGTIRLSRGPAWSSATSRGTGAGTTELERVDGRLVNKVSIANGPGAQRGTYVGTVRSDSSAQLNDTEAKRFVWNKYNDMERTLGFTTAFANYNYTTLAPRQANGSTSYRVEVLAGLNEHAVSATLTTAASNSSAGVEVTATFGLDSTTTASSLAVGGGGEMSVANMRITTTAVFHGLVGLGYHALNWLESSHATGTTTWYSDGGSGNLTAQTGIRGRCRA